MFATLSLLFLFAVLVCIVWCIIIRRKRFQKQFPGEQQFLISDPFQVTPSYIPHTIPKIVQTPASRSSASSTQPHHFQLPLIAGRYYHSETVRSTGYASSSRSEPIINHLGTSNEKLVSRALPRDSKNGTCYTSSIQLNEGHRHSSRPSSRASSFRSEDLDAEQKETGIQNKDVYIHSALVQAESPEFDDKEGQFVADDHIVSYDQDNGITDANVISQKGALIVTLFYDTESSELNIVIKQAIDLPLKNGKEEDLNVYVNFCLVPEDFYWQRTISVLQTRNPVFNQTFQIADVLHHKLRQYTLCFLIMDASGFQDTLIGKVMIPLSELRGGVEIEMCRELAD